MKKRALRIGAIAACALMLTAMAAPQVREVIKILGVGAAVKQFGPDINRAFNNITGHKDSNSSYTKVVPIITVGLNSRGAIGAAQVMGAKENVEKVGAVAAPEANFLGNEIKLRAMIPVSDANITDAKNLKSVDGVGVSGIVDLKL